MCSGVLDQWRAGGMLMPGYPRWALAALAAVEAVVLLLAAVAGLVVPTPVLVAAVAVSLLISTTVTLPRTPPALTKWRAGEIRRPGKLLRLTVLVAAAAFFLISGARLAAEGNDSACTGCVALAVMAWCGLTPVGVLPDV